MTSDQSHHPDYGHIRGGAQYDVLHFEDTDELSEMAAPPVADAESNELHAGAGTTCAHCGQPIESGADVRKLLDGHYVHELCPAH